MSDTHPTPQTKLAIVKEAWAGRKIAKVARKYQVCRDSIYTWMHAASQACLHALSPQKRGPKFKKLLEREEVILSLEQKVSGLESEIKRLSHDSQSIPSVKYAKLVRPDRCPHCGHTRILLNGYYPVKEADGAFVDMPRFICKQCRKRVYL
ncbi:MAG: helix-turn-helix domain-containing protein [Deltaproteobacteria bacterium]|nr:helix-turn-helix domain-containing protein [Deltaproteobacteria bacterium]